MSSFRHGAIPTEYKGVRFRSRTEARWAAFFDAMRWSWEYEPYDMQGWIPDFALKLRSGERLVEVKPAGSFEELASFAGTRQLSSAPEGTILLGSAPMVHGCRVSARDLSPGMHIGIDLQRVPLRVIGGPVEQALGTAVYTFFLEQNGYEYDGLPKLVAPVLAAAGVQTEFNALVADNLVSLSLCACGATVSIDLLDCECEDHHPTDWAADGIIRDAWAKAQNATQWKGAR